MFLMRGVLLLCLLFPRRRVVITLAIKKDAPLSLGRCAIESNTDLFSFLLLMWSQLLACDMAYALGFFARADEGHHVRTC